MGQVIQMFPRKTKQPDAETQLLIRQITLEHQITLLEVTLQLYTELMHLAVDPADALVARRIVRDTKKELEPLRAEYLQQFGL